MKKTKLLIFLLVLIIANGCASSVYNVPFVDTEETLALNPGMTKEEVLGVMQEPLYVELGDGETRLIHWVYEVRSNDVLSDIMKSGQVVPNKMHKTRKSTAPLHHIKLTFKDGSLARWTILNSQDTVDDKKGEEETTIKKKKKKYKFFASPKLSFHNIKYDFTPEPRYYYNYNYIDNGESYEDCGDDYEYDEYWDGYVDYNYDWYTGNESYTAYGYCRETVKNEGYTIIDKHSNEYDPILFGLNIGFERINTRLSLDLQAGDSEMLFLKIEQRNVTRFGLNFALSVGFFDFSDDDSYYAPSQNSEYEGYDDNLWYDYRYEGLVSLGVGKQFLAGPLSIEPAFNILFGEYRLNAEEYRIDENYNYSNNSKDGGKLHPYVSIAFGLNKLK